jgi:hypothetical protein
LLLEAAEALLQERVLALPGLFQQKSVFHKNHRILLLVLPAFCKKDKLSRLLPLLVEVARLAEVAPAEEFLQRPVAVSEVAALVPDEQEAMTGKQVWELLLWDDPPQ